MALNWRESSVISAPPVRARSAGTRRARSPSARALAASVSRRSGVVKRRARKADTTMARSNAPVDETNRNPTTLAIVFCLVV